jgi:phospholipid/cholesterol/gamma-HCH transport system substrate-binding protein
MRWTYEFKVGIFSLAALLVIAYMFFVLSPDMFRSRSENNYFTIIDDASGIVAKTQVKTSGVVIGKVKIVQLDGNQSRIDFSISSDTKLPRDSEVAIKEKGLLGDVFLEVIRAEDKGVYLKNGDYLAPAKEQASISKLISAANSIGKDIKKITSAFADVIGGEDGRKNLSSIVTDVRDVASSLKGILSENREGLKHIIANLDRTTQSLDGIVSGRKGDLAQVVTNFREITESLRDVLRPENREKFDKILSSLEGSMGKINKGEGSLGRLVNDDKLIENVEGAVKDLRELIAPAKKMQVAIDFHAEYRGDSRTQGYISVMLQPRPDKYYLLGITDVIEAEKDSFVERVPPRPGETSPDALSSTRYHTTSVERKNLRFNVQYAQRWDIVQFRFGLFETTGGIATDFFLLDNTIRVSLEAFDFRKTTQRNFARIKTYASILFFNHVYAMLGVDDLTRVDPSTGKKAKPYYFIGTGFRFTDDDLKGLFGLASTAL